jgi:hypothetical protein
VRASIHHSMHTVHVSVVVSKHGEPVRLLRVLRTTRNMQCTPGRSRRYAVVRTSCKSCRRMCVVLYCRSGRSRCLDANMHRARNKSSPQLKRCTTFSDAWESSRALKRKKHRRKRQVGLLIKIDCFQGGYRPRLAPSSSSRPTCSQGEYVM